MKTQLFSLLFLITSASFAQRMNNAGHFINNEEPTRRSEMAEAQKLGIPENTVFKTPHGFVALSANYENSPTELMVYSPEGKKRFSKTFRQVINFQLSSSKNYATFFDFDSVRVLNFENLELKSYLGSTVFALNNYGIPAVYLEKTGAVFFNGTNYPADGPVYGILFWNEQPLFHTRTGIFLIRDQQVVSILNLAEGRVFEMLIIEKKLWLSTKKEAPGKFIFTSYSSPDLEHFGKEEEKIHKLKNGTAGVKKSPH